MKYRIKTTWKTVLMFAIFLFFYFSALGHSGRTDTNGGHTNRNTGEYHTHNSESGSDENGAIIWVSILVVLIIGVVIKEAINNDE